MAEIMVIAPAEMALALRLAGLAVLSARNAAEAHEHVQDIRARGEVELVLLPEHFLSGFAPAAYREVLASDDPYFVALPMDWRGRGDARQDFESRLGRILGCHVNVTPERPASTAEGAP